MDINEFYKRVLASLDVSVDEGFLYVGEGDEREPLKYSGAPLALPTRDHIKTTLSEDENGKIVNVKHLYNPLDETIIKGDSVSLTMTKRLVTTRLANRLAIAGRLLLIVSENEKLQAKSSMLINQFLMRLSEADNPGIKKIVDESTISKWIKIYDQSFEKGATKILTVFVKKGGRLGTTKYHRVSTLKFPVYEELLKMDKKGAINGVQLRNKDIKVFKILFEYLVEDITDKAVVATGSMDKEAPGFISLFTQYLKIMTKIQEVIKGVKDADQEWYDAGVIDIQVDLNELSDISGYKKALAGIPREGDIVKSKLRNTPSIPRNVIDTTAGANVSLNAPANSPVQQQPVEESRSSAAIHKALYQGVSGVNVPTIAQQRPVMQQPMQQPMGYQQPMSYQQPVQRPIMQQPMMPMQQPMMGPGNMVNPNVSIGAYNEVGAFGDGAKQPPMMMPNSNVWGR